MRSPFPPGTIWLASFHSPRSLNLPQNSAPRRRQRRHLKGALSSSRRRQLLIGWLSSLPATFNWPSAVHPLAACSSRACRYCRRHRQCRCRCAPLDRAPRRRVEPVEMQPLQPASPTDPVLGFVDQMRQVNTLQARAFVQDFNAGRITRRDVIRVMQSQGRTRCHRTSVWPKQPRGASAKRWRHRRAAGLPQPHEGHGGGSQGWRYRRACTGWIQRKGGIKCRA